MKVALCCIGRRENQYAVEFVEWYKSLGFDKIFIYDNNHDGEENFEDVLQEHMNNGFVNVLKIKNRESIQLSVYNHCYKTYGNEYDWIAFLDFDEFIHLNGFNDIHSFLNQFNDFECVVLNWMIMTDNGQVYNTRRPLQERFAKPMDYNRNIGYDFPENNHVKSIVKGHLESVEFKNNPHVPTTTLKCCNANGESVEQKPFVPYNFSKAYIKHYQFKTIEEWVENKMKKGTSDRKYEDFISNTKVEVFFKVNEPTIDKLEYATSGRKQKIIVSMTTIPKRMKRLSDNIPYLLRQSYQYDKLIINVDDNLSEQEYEWYDKLKELDERIEINKSEAKWRSCNKLLPTMKKYPNDIVVTLDDDVAYPVDTIKYLVEEHEKHPECIIAHEVNPIQIKEEYRMNGNKIYKDKFITYVNGYDVKLMQVEWGKYLSNCALFPPYSFDEDIYDYDKMMECTNGTHDELWFWIQSTIHGVQCVGLNYVRSFAPEMLEEYKDGEYNLSQMNNADEKINDYMVKINKMYGKRLMDNIDSKPCVFTITKDNIYPFIFLYPYVKTACPNFSIITKGLTKDWKNKLINVITEKEKARI